MESLRNNFEQLANSLIGDTIIGVHYYHYPSDFAQDNGPFHHSNGGLDFSMGSGRVIGISWGRQFVNFNLNIIEETLAYHLINPKITRVEMTQRPSWLPIISKSIQQVNTYWRWVITTSGQESNVNPVEQRQYYPQDMEVAFDNGFRFYISVSKYLLECDCFLQAMDNISVLFDEHTAKKYLPSFVMHDQSS